MAYADRKGRDAGLITAVFSEWNEADRAYREIIDRPGYDEDDVSIVLTDEVRDRYLGDEATRETELGTKAAEGAGYGAAVGGTIGGIAGAIAAAAAPVVFPGIGIVLSGPLAAALAGAGAGGAGGSLIGALVGAGIPEERVKHYEREINEGGILLAVEPKTTEDIASIERILDRNGGQHIHR